MKRFVEPEIEIMKFEVEDIVTGSIDNNFPIVPVSDLRENETNLIQMD